MKNRLLAILAVLTLATSGAFSISVLAQTTDEGPAPSDQPSAPMEMGQPQGPEAPSYGQPNDAQPTEAEPGGPEGEAPATTDQGVARISLIHGDVSTQRGDSGDWSAATLNQPVMGGDKVSTADGARAELQLDFANLIRLGPNSKANIANFTKKDIQIQLSEGILNYSVSKDSEVEPEIDTPNVSVHPAHHDGVFRIEVRPDGDTVVIVRKGEAQIATPQGSTEVQAGEMATVRGTADTAQYKISEAPDRDDWDQWNSDRDHVIQNANSWRHTNGNHRYTGAQDLDAYGQWKNVPDYGDVWVPNEGSDWAPYRDGNWVYEPYYGWTWVGYEPWGWAPYHYGRWFPYGGAWAWWPGPAYVGYNPFWAPAYVSFWGWGGGFGFGVGFGGWGGFGWLPIGPCDYFHPWWGGYRGRFGVVGGRGWNGGRFGGFRPLHGGNRFSNIANFHDPHVGRGMSAIGAGKFGGGPARPVAVTRQQLGGARMMAGNLPVVPSHASLSASGRAAAPSTVRNGSQRFFGSVHNNMARPVSFQQQTASLRQTMQRSHVGAIPAGGRFGGESVARGTPANGTMQKPSAGSFSNRETNSADNRSVGTPTSVQNGNRSGYRPLDSASNSPATRPTGSANAGTSRGAEPGNRGGFRPFAPPSNSTRPAGSTNSIGPVNRGSENLGSRNSGFSGSAPQRGTMQPAPSGTRDGFRPFTPPSQSQISRGQSGQPSSSASRGSSGTYWNRTAPSSMGSRPSYGSSSGSYSAPSGSYGRGTRSGSTRPQLDMRQPIVRPPSYGGSRVPYSGSHAPSYNPPRSSAPRSYSAPPSYGGSHGTPSYGGSHGSPSYGGGHSAPSGGGHSAPSGGGHSSGGGGGHSSGGGGSHSSGGGSHSSGGHH